MQFQVPQFLDVEDKIFGPLTLKQFLYMAGGGALSFILFFVFETWLWIAVTAVFAVIAVALAFGKYNGRPIIHMLIAAFQFAWQPKLYLWQYNAAQQEPPRLKSLEAHQSGSALKDLFLKLTTGKTER